MLVGLIVGILVSISIVILIVAGTPDEHNLKLYREYKAREYRLKKRRLGIIDYGGSISE